MLARSRSYVFNPQLWLTISCLIHLSACSDDGHDYFPLSEGLAWHYNIARTTMDGTFQQKQILQSLAALEWQDQTAVPMLSAGGAQYLYIHDERGVRQTAVKNRGTQQYRQLAMPLQVLPADLERGTNWHQTEYTQVLENTGTPWETLFKIAEPVSMEYVVIGNDALVSVPAGEFPHCIKVQGRGEAHIDVGNYIGQTVITVSVENYYAKGIGLVKSIRRESTTSEALDYGEITLELEYLAK